MISEMKNLLKITGGGLRFITLLVLRSPVDLLMTVIQAVFLQNAFNAVGHNDTGLLTAACIAFVVACLCIFLYNGTVWSVYAPFVVRMESRLRIKLFDKITKFSCKRIGETPQGEWITRLNTDIQMPFSQPNHLPHAVNSVLRIIVSSVILWRINPAVFGWVTLFIVPHIICSQLLVARVMPKLNKKVLEATDGATSEMTAFITCADTALLYDAQDYLMGRFEKSSLDIMRTKMRIWKKNALNAAIAVLPFGLSGYLVLLIVSSGWITNGSMAFGDLAGAFQYRIGLLIGSNMLINCMISIQASMAGIRRINGTMLEKTEEANG